MSKIEKILYVEDEKDIQMIAQIALQDIGGFTLEVCSSGDEAISKAQEFSPDLILLDVMMPGLDGPQTLQELRKIDATANTPVIFMTAKVQPQEIQYYKNLGAVEVISKPFDPMTLAQSIKDIMAES
jgi:CheY-like chemotaxis protein